MRASSRRSRLCVWGFVPIASGAAFLFATCSHHDTVREQRSNRPNVLIVLIDTLRADRVDSKRMPFLSRLATESVFYERAYAPAPWTLPTIVSIFTAQYPTEHGVGRQWFASKMSDSTVTLAEVLASEGYTTVALSGHAGINQRNCGQGFAYFETVDGGTDAEHVNVTAFAWFDGRSTSDAPWFLYLHYLDMHTPYRFHPGITSERENGEGRDDDRLGFRIGAGALARTEAERREVWNYTPFEVVRIQQLYDGEARYFDHRLAELFGGLQRRGALEHTIVVLTADHGEEFGEHGAFGHGVSLYEPVTRVPLIIQLPDRYRSHIREPVQIAGLGPTLLRELDIAAPAAFRIPSFRLRADAVAGEPIYMELPKNNHLQLRLHDSAVVGATAKLVLSSDGAPALYDLVADPGEQEPKQSLPQASELGAALTQMRARLESPAVTETIDLDQATIEHLRHLGYGD